MKKNYTQSTYYQIRLTARYLKILGTQFFEKIKAGMPFDEFVALDVISKEGPMCQRDLAKLLLKDRANTGRIALSLEKKKYIEIVIEQKNSRLIKKLTVTKNGENFIDEITQKLEPTMRIIEEKFDEAEEKQLSASLKKCREILKTIIEMQI